jgi:hypothetical protein
MPSITSSIQKLQHSPVDEFGIKHLNLIYNQEDDLLYCLIDAPDNPPAFAHKSAILFFNSTAAHNKSIDLSNEERPNNLQILLIRGELFIRTSKYVITHL